MSDAAKKASFSQIAKGFFGGFLKAGFLITIVVYILNTFILKGMGIETVVITSLMGVLLYLGFVFRSTNRANRHEGPEVALKDSMGDLFLLPVLLTLALIWTFLPNFSGMQVVHSSYFVTLAFLWSMFGLCWIEAIVTISNSLYQMYRMEQVTMERTSH